jgi:hypothetical protein
MDYELRYFEKTVRGELVIRAEAFENGKFVYGASARTENEAKALVIEHLKNNVQPYKSESIILSI